MLGIDEILVFGLALVNILGSNAQIKFSTIPLNSGDDFRLRGGLVFVANIFNFQTSLCDINANEALIASICRQVQDLQFCLTTFRLIIPSRPYVPEEVTQAAITKSLQNANDNHAFVETAKANDYNGVENDLAKCPQFVSDCQNVLGSKTTPEMLDRSRKQFDLVLMAKIAEQLIKK
ncbi:hypothetical protein H5410_055351 [Solanum commersonii]|uniref:Pectinesterase inhibitor domain-containing protein n=1 Tax=Solanum commersonii TaxID=4109 RepID=A0A9J5WHC9_SOLCO|nr:hypothetical protein H5410_055351 [Solanum commersonii]